MREEESTSSYGSMYEFREFSQGCVLSLMKASQNLTFCLFYGIIYVENEGRKRFNASELKFFQKNFFTGLFLSWVFVHLQGHMLVWHMC